MRVAGMQTGRRMIAGPLSFATRYPPSVSSRCRERRGHPLDQPGDLTIADLRRAFGCTDDVGLRDHADAFTLTTDDGNATDLPLFHDALDVLQVVIGRAAARAQRHDLGDARVRTEPGGETATCEVSVGDHTHESTCIVDDRDTSAVVILHEPRGVLNGVIRSAARGVACHDLVGFHLTV